MYFCNATSTPWAVAMRTLGLTMVVLGYAAFLLSLSGVRRWLAKRWSDVAATVTRRAKAARVRWQTGLKSATQRGRGYLQRLRNWASTRLRKIGIGDGGQAISVGNAPEQATVHDPAVVNKRNAKPTPESNQQMIDQLAQATEVKLAEKDRAQARDEEITTWWGIVGFALGSVGTVLLALA